MASENETTTSHGAAVVRLCSCVGTSPLALLRPCNAPVLRREAAHQIVELCREVLFPGFFVSDDLTQPHKLEQHMADKCNSLRPLLSDQIAAALAMNREHCPGTLHDDAAAICESFMNSLPSLRDVLSTDVEALYMGDPAASSTEEVVYCYPGLRAVTNYRLAHRLLELGVPVLPRLISEMAHSETGIDIHPAATIGHHFAIDHGTGVVVGATAIIGNHVKLYQGVTLGARSFDLDDNGNPVKGLPRHPIIGDNVIVYSNATILGQVHVGNGAVVGGNIWLTTDVPPGAKVVQAMTRRNK